MNAHKEESRCCVCQATSGESAVFTRWPGSRRQYCAADWEKIGRFRALPDMSEMSEEASL